MEFLFDAEADSVDLGSVPGKLAYVRRLLPLVATMTNQVERTEYLSELVKRTGIAPAALADELHRLKQGPTHANSAAVDHYFPGLGPERLVVQLLLTHRAWIPYTRQRLLADCLQDLQLRAILQALYGLDSERGDFDIATLIEALQDERCRDLVARLGLEPVGDEAVQQQIDDCLMALQRRQIETQLQSLKEAMHEAEQSGDMVRLADLQQQFAELRRTLIR
jgi:DNA primase